MFKYRKYDDYDQYVRHQKSKAAGWKHEPSSVRMKNLKSRISRILEAFPQLKSRQEGVVICLGARFGEEVLCFRELGFKKSLGIDLEPSLSSGVVIAGDFHHLPYADSSVSVVYTNSMDHAFDLKRVADECMRVLIPGGLVALEVCTDSRLTVDGRDKSGLLHIEKSNTYESVIWGSTDDVKDCFVKSGLKQRGSKVVTSKVWCCYLLRK